MMPSVWLMASVVVDPVKVVKIQLITTVFPHTNNFLTLLLTL